MFVDRKKITMYEGKNVVGYATITNIFNPILCKFEKEQGYSRSAINAQLNEMIKQNKALGRKSCMSKIIAPRHILDYCSINDEGDIGLFSNDKRLRVELLGACDEKEYAIINGWEALEDKFEAVDIDIFKLNRKSII